MNSFRRTFFFCGLLSLAVSASSFTLIQTQTQQNVAVTTNEGAAIKSLRTLMNAETKYQSAHEKGDFGDLNELLGAGLIDPELARGLKDGYRFTVVIKKSTLTSPAAVDLVARPSEYGKTGRRSFYLTETGVMLTSEEKDAPLSAMTPFASKAGDAKTTDPPKAEPDPESDIDGEESARKISANEESIIAALGTIHAAQSKYITKEGSGAYGTLAQLEKAGLISKTLSASTAFGYSTELKLTAAKTGVPAAFSIAATPQTYGGSGRRSFFIDQTGIVRGADKEGGPADETDPSIQ